MIGGFHLLDPPREQVEGTLDYFKNNRVEAIYPCHCTGFKFKLELARYALIEEVGVGLSLTFDN